MARDDKRPVVRSSWLILVKNSIFHLFQLFLGLLVGLGLLAFSAHGGSK